MKPKLVFVCFQLILPGSLEDNVKHCLMVNAILAIVIPLININQPNIWLSLRARPASSSYFASVTLFPRCIDFGPTLAQTYICFFISAMVNQVAGAKKHILKLVKTFLRK